jgi:alkanesulfonate monooxygenase SsuD/methylene tetrahydromethanopterin reductase-like flavin-dependent oxidoreductase (luciferase family)
MRISMTLPTMAGGIDAGLLADWCQMIDQGPFHALAVGERIGFDNLEMHTALSYAAAATSRVRLASTLTVLPMHATATAAKRLATLDVVSGGRLDVVVGVGGRDEDFRLNDRSFAARHQRLDEQVEQMRSIWAGHAFHGSQVGPAPVQPGGPPIFASAMGPLSTARAARWADGNMGFSLSPNHDDHGAVVDSFRTAWSAAGRVDPPYLSTSFWYSVADDPEQELNDYAHRYLAVFGEQAATWMASQCTAAGPEALKDAVGRCADGGFDELYLVPCSTALRDLEQTATVLA